MKIITKQQFLNLSDELKAKIIKMSLKRLIKVAL